MLFQMPKFVYMKISRKHDFSITVYLTHDFFPLIINVWAFFIHKIHGLWLGLPADKTVK